MRKLIILFSVLFCAYGTSAQITVSKQFQLSGKTVNKISNDSSLIQSSQASLVTEWAVKNYFDNRLQSVTIRTGNSYLVSDQAEMLALSAIVGDVAIRSDLNKSYILGAIPATTLGNWRELLSPGQLLSFAGRTGVIVPQSGDYNYSQISGTPAPVVLLPGEGISINQTGNNFTVTGTQEPVISASNAIRNYWTGYKTYAPLNTDSIAEGAQKFFTDARVLAALQKASPTKAGIVKPGRGLAVDSLTGELSTKAALLTPKSVPFVANDGELTENVEGLSWDGNNLNVGKSGFYEYTGLRLNGGRATLSASGFGAVFSTSGGQPMDLSKSITFKNSSTDYGTFRMGSAVDSTMYFSSNSTFYPTNNLGRSLGTPTRRWNDVYARYGRYDSLFIGGVYFDPANGGTGFTLQPATPSDLGGVRIGTGLVVDGSGVVSNPFNKSLTDTYYEPVFGKNTAFNKSFGTGSNNVVEGNDSRVLNGQTAFDSLPSLKEKIGTKLDTSFRQQIGVRNSTGLYYDTIAKQMYIDTNKIALKPVLNIENNRTQGYYNLKDTTGNPLFFSIARYWNGSAYVADLRSLGVGLNAAKRNTGKKVYAFGEEVAYDNTGSSVFGSGYRALRNNKGDYVYGIGESTLQYNTGNSVNGVGYYTGRYNQGSKATMYGERQAENNTGNDVTVMGASSLTNNNSNSVISVGGSNNISFVADMASLKTVLAASINTGSKTFTIPSHGYIKAVNLRYNIVSGAGVTGMVDGNIYQFIVVDANTLSYTGTMSSVSGSISLVNSRSIAGSIAVGNNVENTKANQAIWGGDNITESIVKGNLISQNTYNKTQVDSITAPLEAKRILDSIRIATDSVRLDALALATSIQNVCVSNVQLSHTGTTTKTLVYTGTIPASAVTANSSFDIVAMYSWPNSVKTKTFRVEFNNTRVAQFTATTGVNVNTYTIVRNRNSLTSQFISEPTAGTSNTFNTTTTSPIVTPSIDFTSDVSVKVYITLEDATETAIIEAFRITINN